MQDNPIKIIFFGDTIGSVGRRILLKAVPILKEEYNPDFTVVNVENLAHGKGVTLNTMHELDPLEFDAYTSGNHVFDKGEHTAQVFADFPTFIRPSNYIGDFPGKGYTRI